MVADPFKHCRNVPAGLCRAGAEFALDDSCRGLDRFKPEYFPFPAAGHSICHLVSCPNALPRCLWLGSGRGWKPRLGRGGLDDARSAVVYSVQRGGGRAVHSCGHAVVRRRLQDRELESMAVFHSSGDLSVSRHRWITSAGGAWNASIVAEYVQQGGQRYNAFGLGDLISQAIGQGRFDVLAAAVLVMALTVVTINRTLWRRLQRIGDYYCRFGG